MSIYYQDDLVQLWHGDCLDILATLPDNSVHAVCTDPPYGLANTSPEQVADTIVRWVNGDRDYLPGGSGFMGKSWDAFVPPVAVWDECLRVLKPGGHVLAFAGSRTVDLMTLGVRLAGFEIRDSIAWLYGSGFPKSLDVSKAIDKAARGVPQGGTDPTSPNHGLYRTTKTEGKRWDGDSGQGYGAGGSRFLTHGGGGSSATEPAASGAAATAPEAEAWQGWGTALKPAFEPIVVARKPLTGTVAGNVLAHGTGALNIEACRIATEDNLNGGGYSGELRRKDQYTSTDSDPNAVPLSRLNRGIGEFVQPAGRWPTNVLLDDSQAAELDKQSGERPSQRTRTEPTKGTAATDSHIGALNETRAGEYLGETGGASRFFPTFRYEAKAPTEERPRVNGIAHPTVKPLDLMRWLVRLVTPPGGTVLDPFAGSGTTAEACVIEGFGCIAIEREADYLPLIEARLTKPLEPVLDLGALS